MLILGRLCALALIGLFTVVLLPSIGRSDIRLNKLDREVSPLHGEPQVALDCDTSTLVGWSHAGLFRAICGNGPH